MENAGKKNIYKCDTCGHQIVTINLADGVTSFMVACRSDRRCTGFMHSMFYNVDQSLNPTHEWYRPEGKELKRMSEAMQYHVQMGGLDLRQVSGGS